MTGTSPPSGFLVGRKGKGADLVKLRLDRNVSTEFPLEDTSSWTTLRLHPPDRDVRRMATVVLSSVYCILNGWRKEGGEVLFWSFSYLSSAFVSSPSCITSTMPFLPRNSSRSV